VSLVAKIDFRRAGIHLGISFGLVLLGAAVSAGCFWGYNSNLREQAKRLADENAVLTGQLSDALGKSSELEGRLAESLKRVGELEERVGLLEETNRRIEGLYQRLRKSIGDIVANLEGLESGFTEFGDELQSVIRFIFEISERG
jgi:chromosome segregation ATPase